MNPCPFACCCAQQERKRPATAAESSSGFGLAAATHAPHDIELVSSVSRPHGAAASTAVAHNGHSSQSQPHHGSLASLAAQHNGSHAAQGQLHSVPLSQSSSPLARAGLSDGAGAAGAAGQNGSGGSGGGHGSGDEAEGGPRWHDQVSTQRMSCFARFFVLIPVFGEQDPEPEPREVSHSRPTDPSSAGVLSVPIS
jgi:hypothetical protein